MKNKMFIKKCLKCGNIVKSFKEDARIRCCDNEMKNIIPNSVDASMEKHVPNYKVVEDEIFVTVNHPMDKEHYIEWVALVSDNQEYITYLYPEQNAECRFKYIPGSTIYSYCNKHELWKNDVK